MKSTLSIICALLFVFALSASISEAKNRKVKVSMGFVEKEKDKVMELSFDEDVATVKDIGEYYLYSIGMGGDHPKLTVRDQSQKNYVLDKVLKYSSVNDGDTVFVRWY